MTDDVIYRSKVKIERVRGPIRNAWLPAKEEVVTFGVHDEVAAHYGTDLGEYPPDATTLDYVVASAAG
jgi:hypothetical protein